MFEVWVDGTRWLSLPSVDACKRMMTTYDPDGTVPMLIRETESQRFLSYEEVWGGPAPIIQFSTKIESKEKIDWALDGF